MIWEFAGRIQFDMIEHLLLPLLVGCMTHRRVFIQTESLAEWAGWGQQGIATH
jgi:hypothetical protein